MTFLMGLNSCGNPKRFLVNSLNQNMLYFFDELDHQLQQKFPRWKNQIVKRYVEDIHFLPLLCFWATEKMTLVQAIKRKQPCENQ